MASKRTLVIVESPSKAKTIGKYLGSTYKVVASIGHVRDLPKSTLGIDIENDFEPKYINIKGKGSLIKEIKAEAKKSDRILLATDPDREGEAISWHLAYLLDLDPKDKIRVEFHEINKETVKAAIKNPRAIDQKLVDAQQARRVLDRLVGYQISPLLWRKVRRGLSAGRVQSAALKILCDRENEIKNFIPKEYWNISVDFEKEKTFNAKVSEYKGKKLNVPSREKAEKVVAELKAGKYTVESVVKKEKVRKPFAPFTTSSLQQDAANKLNFTTRKTMMVVQQLYEGIDIKGQGTTGLVTYIRTDSVRVSDEARKQAQTYILDVFGKEYTANNVYTNRKKEVQDAHEAIRPTRVEFDPEVIKESLTRDQYLLYKLIWTRFIASQMAQAVFDSIQVSIANGDYGLKATGSKRCFDGYQRVYSPNFDEDKDSWLPELKEGEMLDGKEIFTEQKFTEPQPRFTEASLVKELEEKNIGRPSTYAPIISTLLDKSYAKREAKALVPTELGFVVTDLMCQYFKETVDIGFTATMEDGLDAVESSDIHWKEIIRKYYPLLKQELEDAEVNMEHPVFELNLVDGEICPNCGKPMALKSGRFGEFLACSGYPECKTTKPIVSKIGVECPDCGGELIKKRSRSGKIFFGCSNYPACNRAYWYKPVNKKCPKCGELLVEKGSGALKLSCSNDNCNYKE